MPLCFLIIAHWCVELHLGHLLLIQKPQQFSAYLPPPHSLQVHPSSYDATSSVLSQVAAGIVVLQMDRWVFTTWGGGETEQSKFKAKVFKSLHGWSSFGEPIELCIFVSFESTIETTISVAFSSGTWREESLASWVCRGLKNSECNKKNISLDHLVLMQLSSR